MRDIDRQWLEKHRQPYVHNADEYRQTEWFSYMREQRTMIDKCCCMCRVRTDGLELHHLIYSGWYQEDIDKDVCMLCRQCHEFVTKNYWYNKRIKPFEVVQK